MRYKIKSHKRERDDDFRKPPLVTWEMKNPLKEMPEVRTKRDAARVVGKVMFHMVIHILPLGRIEGFRDLVKILKHLSLLKGWDVKHNLSNLQLAVLKIRWDHAKQNTPIDRSLIDEVDLRLVTEILATDAARKGYGYVHITNGHERAPVEGSWTADE